jgi:hypothetical protein
MDRPFRVVPAVLVQSQILNNNLGTTFLPLESLTDEWAESANGAPVVVNHPTARGGHPISARSPAVLNVSGCGLIFGAKIENEKLVGEVWIDEARSAAVNGLAPILEKLDNGETVELSTGFPVFIDRTPGVHNGKKYDAVIRPGGGLDHLAIFADQIGACSVADGCGLAANHEGPCDVQNTDPADPPEVDAVAGNSTWQRFVMAAARALGLRKAENESDEDRRAAVRSALSEKFGGDDKYVWVESMDSKDNSVVWEVEGDGDAGLFQASFTMGEDGSITLGDPVKVRRVTTFEPVANAGDHSQEADMNRTQMIAQLVAAGPLDEAALSKLSDCQLKALAAPPAANVEEPKGDGWDKAREYRAELDALKAQTANAVESEQKERARLLDDVLYAKESPWTDDEVKGMGINELRKVHAALCRKSADYTGRGGPRAGNGAPVLRFASIMDGPAGSSVLDGKEAN